MPTYEASLWLREKFAPPEAEYGQFPVWMDYSITDVMQDIESNPKVVHARIPFFDSDGTSYLFYLHPRSLEFLDEPVWRYMGEEVTALDMEYYENLNILTKWCKLDENAAKYALEWIFQWGSVMSVSEFLDHYGEIEQISESEIEVYEGIDFTIFQDAAFNGAIAIR